jgi:hypothetical protein
MLFLLKVGGLTKNIFYKEMINHKIKNLPKIGRNRMGSIAIIIVLIISLWSVTETLEKLKDKILEKQNKQNDSNQ